MVYSCLKQLRKEYPHIRVSVVIAYLPTEKRQYEDMSNTMYPEIEGHPKFAIERRNRWMIAASDYIPPIPVVAHSNLPGRQSTAG